MDGVCTPIPALNIKIRLNKIELMHKAFVLVDDWQFGPHLKKN